VLREAVTIDTGFAYAYLTIGAVYDAMSEPGRSNAALRHAIANQHRLPYVERYFAVGMYTSMVTRDLETATDAYRRILERFPDNVSALNNLALIHRERREYAAAESLWARAIGVDSTIPVFYYGLHTVRANRGAFAESRRTLDLIARRFPGDGMLGTAEVQDAAARLDWDAAERRALAKRVAERGDKLQLVDAYESLAGIVMTQGRLAEAEGHWRTHLALSAQTGSRGRHLFGVVRLAYLQLRHRNAPDAALALVDSTLRRVPLDSVLPADRPYDELARFYAAAGRPAHARRLVEAADANDRSLGRSLPEERSWTRGAVALAAGDAARAQAELEQAARTHACAMCALPDLARAYEAGGKPEAAVVVYERYLGTPWLWRYETDAMELGWAMRRLAALYDARGEPGKASAMRRRLLQLWRRADPELAPVLAEARARLAG